MFNKKCFIIITIIFIIFTVMVMPGIYASDTQSTTEVLKLVNTERSSYGLVPLQMDLELSSAADIRSNDIVILFEHVRPNGIKISTLSDKLHGENIASGPIFNTPQQVVNAWMNSPPHKANILNPEFKSIGIGHLKIGNTHYWVQLFSRDNALSRLKAPSSVKILSKKNKAIIYWKKVPNAKGYEVYRATRKKGVYSRIKIIKSSSSIKFTNYNLKKRTYYYKIRSFSIVNNKKVYRKFSSIKAVKVK